MLKESNQKESRGWKYKELTFDFRKYEQISMFDKGVNYETCKNIRQK